MTGEKPSTKGTEGARQVWLAVLLTSLVWLSVAGGLLWQWRRPEPAVFEILPAPATATPAPSATPLPLLVHVTGAVRRPGVFWLAPGSRVQQAIDAAGGLNTKAETRLLELARPVSDGETVYIPEVGEAPSVPDPGATQDAKPRWPLNINTASVEALQALPSIGPVTAQAIVDYRRDNGPFLTARQLLKVHGIGPITLEQIGSLIVVQQPYPLEIAEPDIEAGQNQGH